MKGWDAWLIAAHDQGRQVKRYAPPVLSVAATLAWMAVTMVFLGSSDPPTPDLSPELKAWRAPILVHLFLFGVLGVLVSVSTTVVGRSKRLQTNMLVVVLVGTLWGLFTELFQVTVPGRAPEVVDLLANGFGSILGGLSAWTMGVWIFSGKTYS